MVVSIISTNKFNKKYEILIKKVYGFLNPDTLINFLGVQFFRQNHADYQHDN